MRWLYHILREGDAINMRDGFVHASFKDQVRESVRLHFSGANDASLVLLQIDPRRLDVKVELAETNRGTMPHIHGVIPSDAVRAKIPLVELESVPDRVTGTRFAFVAFEGMTLLDLVGVLDPVSRIKTMGFDPESSMEVVSADRAIVWARCGAKLEVERVRPSLSEFDAVVIAGGPGTRTLVNDRAVIDWLAAFPQNRLVATVCTGSVLLGATGRLRGLRATTHHTELEALANQGAIVVKERVVDEGSIITAGGVTSAVDLGIYLVRRFEGDDVAAKIARQMELPGV